MNRIFRTFIIALAVAIGATSLSACGDDGAQQSIPTAPSSSSQETVRLDIQYSDELSYTEMQAAKNKVIASLKQHGVSPGPNPSVVILVPTGSYKYLERISGVEHVSTY